MSWLPKTLRGRTFLLIATLIILSLSISTMVLRQIEQEPRAHQLTQLVVSVVNLTRAAILSAAPQWRSALLAELADTEGLQIQFAEQDDVLEPMTNQSPETHLMIKKVREKLGIETRFAARHNGKEALWVSFFIGDDELWLALPKERIEHPVSHVLFMGAGIVSLLSLIGAYWVARQIAKPLKSLTQSANIVRQGKIPAPLPEQGAAEIVTVSRAFNQMSHDLEANERERALVLAGISHDLRTPLARIRLAAEISNDDILREGLNLDVEQMDSVIQQFLDYARLEEESPVMTDMEDLLRTACKPYVNSAKSLTFEVTPLSTCLLYPQMLKRALSNLLDNAIKYGGGEITVQLMQKAGQITIEISDRGIGIPERQRDAVKRPFVRLETARSDATGSGLGLAIVERAARLHGGSLHLRTRDGGGMTARLTLAL